MTKYNRKFPPMKVCPDCGGKCVIKGSEEYGGGWVCWKKKGGCGAKFEDGDPAIEDQSTEGVDFNNSGNYSNLRSLIKAPSHSELNIRIVTGSDGQIYVDVIGASVEIVEPSQETATGILPKMTGKSNDDPWQHRLEGKMYRGRTIHMVGKPLNEIAVPQLREALLNKDIRARLTDRDVTKIEAALAMEDENSPVLDDDDTKFLDSL